MASRLKPPASPDTARSPTRPLPCRPPGLLAHPPARRPDRSPARSLAGPRACSPTRRPAGPTALPPAPVPAQPRQPARSLAGPRALIMHIFIMHICKKCFIPGIDLQPLALLVKIV